MANLITTLAVSGCRNSDGTPCASGYVFLYSPGTTTIVPGYTSDALTQAWTTVGGGIPLDAGGRAAIWVDRRVDVVVTNASGGTVESLLGFNGTTANAVEVTNAGYTGAVTDPATGAVTQGAGGLTDLDTILTRLYASLGGTDGYYQESSGATKRTVQAVLRSIAIFPEDFGAVGNGVADDTTAVQAVLNEAARLKVANVIFSGTYKTSSTVTLPASSGVTLSGTGAINQISNSGSGDVLAVAISTSFKMYNLQVVGTVTMTSPTSAVIDECNIAGQLTGNTYGLGVSGVSSDLTVNNSTIFGATNAILSTNVAGVSIEDSSLQSDAGAAIQVAGTTASVYCSNTAFASPTGIAFTAGATGTVFNITDCPTIGALPTPIDISAIAYDPLITQRGNGIDGGTYSAAVGNALTIKRYQGSSPILIAASGGAGIMTVAAPTPTPASGQGIFLDVTFVNASGGAVTWTMNAAFVLAGAVAIPTTAAHTINVRFHWDATNSKWREVSRGDTVT